MTVIQHVSTDKIMVKASKSEANSRHTLPVTLNKPHKYISEREGRGQLNIAEPRIAQAQSWWHAMFRQYHVEFLAL